MLNIVTLSSLRNGVITLLLCLCAGSVPAQTDPQAARFSIQGYEVTGNSLLPETVVQDTVSPFTGPHSSFETIQNALKALESRYVEAGYGTVRVFLPEQEVEAGRIKLTVIEAKVGSIKVEGNKHFGEDNIRASVPTLVEGGVPQMDDISASLRVANESGSKQTSLVFRPSPQDNQVDAVLRVADEDPLKLGLSLDNTGSKPTGVYRLGLLAQHSNLFGLDHIGSVQVVTSPGHYSDVRIFGMGYRIPLYRLGGSIDLAYGYSNVNSGTLNTAGGDFGISGSGYIFSAKYNFYLPRWSLWEQKLAVGLDYRAFQNKIVPVGGGGSIVPDATVHPISATYSGLLRDELLELTGYITYAHNIPGGSDGTADDFNRPGGRLGAKGWYDHWRYGITFGYFLPQQWTLRANFSGQYTNDLLISGEMFGIGGHDSVRGFLEREIANDRGHRGSIELYTPDFGKSLGSSALRAQALVFYDAGQVIRNRPLAGEQRSESIASAGLGLRLSYARNLNFKLDYGVVTQAGGTRKAGDGRLHGSLMWLF